MNNILVAVNIGCSQAMFDYLLTKDTFILIDLWRKGIIGKSLADRLLNQLSQDGHFFEYLDSKHLNGLIKTLPSTAPGNARCLGRRRLNTS